MVTALVGCSGPRVYVETGLLVWFCGRCHAKAHLTFCGGCSWVWTLYVPSEDSWALGSPCVRQSCHWWVLFLGSEQFPGQKLDPGPTYLCFVVVGAIGRGWDAGPGQVPQGPCPWKVRPNGRTRPLRGGPACRLAAPGRAAPHGASCPFTVSSSESHLCPGHIAPL